MAQNIRTIVYGVLAPVITALNTTHDRVSLAIAGLVAGLNGKANLIHTHTISDITNLPQFTRSVLETFVNSDGVTVTLPWSVDEVATLDVFVAGVRIKSSVLTVSGNVLTFGASQGSGTSVSIVRYSDVTTSGVEVISPFISGLTIFTSLSQNSFQTSGGGSSDGNTIFSSYGASKFDTGASALGSSDTVFSSLGPADFT